MLSVVATKLSSVRALNSAYEKEQPLVTVCSACHNVIKQTNYALQNDKDFASKVNNYSGINYNGETVVYHYLELLRDVIPSKIEVRKSKNGSKLSIK